MVVFHRFVEVFLTGCAQGFPHCGKAVSAKRYIFAFMNEKLKVEEMHRLDIEAYKQSDKFPLIVVLDNVRSLHNVGSVFRTADAFRLSGVWLCGITATPPSPEIHKTALGAEDAVDWHYCADTLEAIKRLKASGVTIIAVEQCRRSTMLQDFSPEAGHTYALVFGHEVHGVAQEVIDAADVVLEIPQFGTKHSLNVSVAAGVVMWEMVRRYI